MTEHRDKIVMVGDKEHDVIGARAEGIPCVAVSYGYGSVEELEKAKPAKIVGTVEELTDVLTQWQPGSF